MKDEMMQDQPQWENDYDYIVVGAGTAGCVVAARLAESGAYRVALIEAGGHDNLFWVRVPLGSGQLAGDPAMTWRYQIQTKVAGNGKQQDQSRGRILGGSASINGMVYIRGHRQDFDDWRALGNVGWGYDDVLPLFKMSEDNVLGDGPYHGKGGPMAVSNALRHEIYDAFLAAAHGAGFPLTEDFNGARQEGFGYCQMSIRQGQRSSSSNSYLRATGKRGNLSVLTDMHVQKIILQEKRAAGVLVVQDGQEKRLRARREVVISCGAFNTPQLLQLSGIGPAEVLRRNGIEVAVDSKGIGRSLKDHFSYSMMYRAAKPITINDYINSPWRKYLMGINYLLFRKGWMATNGNSCNGFVRSDPSLPAPDVRLNLCMWNRVDADKLRPFSKRIELARFSSFHVNLNLLRPECDGEVEIASPDPREAPRVEYRFGLPEHDARAAIFGIRTTRTLMSMPSMRPYVKEEVGPGLGCQTDAGLLEFCRKNGGASMHSVGSCRMGVDDDAVVDPRLRVRGVDGLRIADASIMPTLVGAGTSPATVMIGEKAAIMMLEDARTSAFSAAA